ncbi:MAG: ferritin-like domain-containing protein [Proteobacteria bacterium]|nr:MAG: ferritin-like domain-containing protein [Pseudomonadota bacterium]
MKLSSIQDALLAEIEDLYSAEQQLLEVLPKMAAKATSAKLKAGFETHLKETQGHVERLEQVFEILGEKPKAQTCKAMKGLLAEGKEVMEEDATPEVMDAFLIAAAQKVEHYEIASYGTVCTWAEVAGFPEAKELLGKTLNEEELTDQKLSALSKTINKKAS